jgi:hypothetical protein
MKKALRIIIPIVVVAAVIAVLAIVKNAARKTKEVPLNPSGTVGNTAGNLYNGGFFAENDGIIYFSNFYDKGKLYSYDPASGKCIKIANGSASLINAAGGYVYYYSSTASDQAGLGYVRNGRGIYRLKLKDKDSIMVAEGESDGVILLDNSLLFTLFKAGEKNDGNADITLCTVPIGGGKPSPLISGHPNVGGNSGGLLYYSLMQETGILQSLDPVTGANTEIPGAHRMYLPDPDGQKIYFLDADDDYHLKVWDQSDQSTRVIADERCDTFNRHGDIIYYQTSGKGEDAYALKRVNTDGTGLETVAAGVYSNISIAGGYVFFRNFQSDVPVYMTPENGPVNIQTFDIAKDAVSIQK